MVGHYLWKRKKRNQNNKLKHKHLWPINPLEFWSERPLKQTLRPLLPSATNRCHTKVTLKILTLRRALRQVENYEISREFTKRAKRYRIMKETFWSKLRELWAIRRRCQQIKLEQRQNRLPRSTEFYAERGGGIACEPRRTERPACFRRPLGRDGA